MKKLSILVVSILLLSLSCSSKSPASKEVKSYEGEYKDRVLAFLKDSENLIGKALPKEGVEFDKTEKVSPGSPPVRRYDRTYGEEYGFNSELLVSNNKIFFIEQRFMFLEEEQEEVSLFSNLLHDYLKKAGYNFLGKKDAIIRKDIPVKVNQYKKENVLVYFYYYLYQTGGGGSMLIHFKDTTINIKDNFDGLSFQ